MTKIFQIFKAPSAEVLAQRELAEAKRRLLEAQSAAEYANAMVQYHSKRIERLTSSFQREGVCQAQ